MFKGECLKGLGGLEGLKGGFKGLKGGLKGA